MSSSRRAVAVARLAIASMILLSAGAFAKIVSMNAVSLSSQTQDNVPVTFGEVFKKGDVPSGAALQATLNGQPIPLQVDAKATNPDGSLRHAVLTVTVPELTSYATRTIDLSTGGSPATGTPVGLNDVLATDFDAEVDLNVGGTVYTAHARQLLQQAQADAACRPWSKQCNVWLFGPLVSEWIVGGPIGSAGGQSPHLAVYFYIRAYNRPVTAIRVNVVIENDWTYVKGPQNITYDATIKLGSQTYTYPALTHIVHSRWHKLLWWGKKAKVYAKLDGRYIQATGAVSQYADVHPTEDFLSSVTQSVSPMGHADQSVGMGATGAQAGIGPLPRWTMAYLLSMDRRAYNYMLANDDAAGHYGTFYRDEKTGRPVTLLDYPYITIVGSWRDGLDHDTGISYTVPACGGDCSLPFRPDRAHQPSIGYLPYIVTGDFYYLEQMQFWTNWDEIWQNPGYRGYAEGLINHNQVRGEAWNLRSLGNTAFITPDDDPLKTYFTAMVHNNIDWYNQRYVNNPDANKLSILGHNSTPYAINGVANVGTAPWMDDYVTWVMDHLVELGFTGAAPMLRWKAKFPVARMTAPGVCWLMASAYALQVRDVAAGPFYTTMKQAYDSTFPDLSTMVCNSPEMREAASKNGLQPNEMFGYAWSVTGYPANLQIALAAAVDSGIPNADEAWQLFMTRSRQPDYSNYANFAVVPRDDPGVVSPSIDIYASPNPVEPGEMTTIHWAATAADTCSADWANSTSPSGTQNVGPISGSKTYALQCAGPGGSTTASVTVTDTTTKPPAVVMSASPTEVAPGGTSTLSWHANDADTCTASGGWSGTVPISGDEVVGPLDADTKFVLECTGSGGVASANVVVNVTATAGDPTGDGSDGSGGAQPPAHGKPGDDPPGNGGGGACGATGLIYLLIAAAAVCHGRRCTCR